MHLRERRQHGTKIDGLQLSAGQLGIDLGGIGDLAQQPVQPLHVLAHEREQLRALLFVGDAPSRIDGAEHGAERVLQLVRHVGNEPLDRVHPHPQRLGHVPQRRREAPDLVVPRREIGDRHLAPAAGTHPFRRARKPAHRAGDRACKEEAEDNGNPERNAERLKNGKAGVADAFQHVAGIRHQE